MFTIIYFGGTAIALLLAGKRTRRATLAILLGGVAAAGYFLLGWGLI